MPTLPANLMAKKNDFTSNFLDCGHCGNLAPLEIVAQYHRAMHEPNPEPDPYEDMYGVPPEARFWEDPSDGWHYELLLCRACKQVTLRERYWFDYREEERTDTLYPPQAIKTYYLPEKVREAYNAARKARAIDANVYALLLGRTLEAVCEDREIKGKNLYEKLEALSKKGEIPENLVKVAHGLRSMRNIGAHKPFEGLSAQEMPLLDDLSKAILEYIYVAPNLAFEAEDRLKEIEKLKARRSKE